MDLLIMKLKYMGYLGINRSHMSVQDLKVIKQLINSNYIGNPVFAELDKTMSNQDRISLEKVRKETKRIMNKYFSFPNIPILTGESVQNNIDYIQRSANAQIAYDKINSLLQYIDPFAIDIKMVNGHAMAGKLVKNLIIIPNYEKESNRKMYFSHVEIGDELNDLSIATFAHEVAHTSQEKNIGYTEDLLNKEIISIFIEKLVAQELDPSGNLLALSERTRFLDLFNRFSQMYKDTTQTINEEKIDNLIYIKSILMAEKLFDKYQREPKLRDGIISDIQKVFDGKIKVEELLSRRNITLENSQNLTMLQRHI